MDVYFQQVASKDGPFSLSFNEDATVKDAKEELSKSKNFSLDGMKLLFKSKILQDAAKLKDMQTSEKTPINFFVKKTNSAQASSKSSSQLPSQPSTETTQPAQSGSSQPPAEHTNPTPPEPSKPSAQPEQQAPVTQPVQPESPKPPSSPSLNPQPAQPFGQPSQPSQPFGEPLNPQPFGQPSPQPFGQPSQPFGQPSQPFGQSSQPSQPFGQPSQPSQPFSPTQPSSNESHVPLQQSRPVFDVDHPLIINEDDPSNPYTSLTKEEALERLTEMGFDKDQCLEALRLTRGIVNHAQNLLVEGDVSEQGLAKLFPQQGTIDRQVLANVLLQISQNPQLIQAVRNGQPIAIDTPSGRVPITIPPQLLDQVLAAKNQMYPGMGAGGYGGMGAGAYGTTPGMGAGGYGTTPGMGAGAGAYGTTPGMGSGTFGGATPGMGTGGGYGGMNPGMGAGAYGTTPGMGAGGYGTTPGMGAGAYGTTPGMGAGGYGGMNPGMGAGGYGALDPQQQQQLQQYQREVAALLSRFTQPEQEEIKTLIREGHEPLNAIQMYDAADKDINAARELLKSCID